jgi:predicted DNA-binding transcriptional regulator AlpA
MNNVSLNLADYSLISIAEASAILGISCKTARNWLSSNKFPISTVRVGGRRMLRAMDLVTYVNQLTSPGQLQSLVDVKPQEQSNAYRKRGRPRKT